MRIKTLRVLVLAMCCNTGVYGSDVGKILIDVQWLKGRGIERDSDDLAQQNEIPEVCGAEGLRTLAERFALQNIKFPLAQVSDEQIKVYSFEYCI